MIRFYYLKNIFWIWKINQKFNKKSSIIPNICSCGMMQKKLDTYLIDYPEEIKKYYSVAPKIVVTLGTGSPQGF